MEGNIVSLSQHVYYGSVLHNCTFITYIELLALLNEGRWGGKKGENLELKSLKTNVKIVFTCTWEIRHTGNGVQKSILPYRKIEGKGIREEGEGRRR